MKKVSIKIFWMFIFSAMILTSCKKWINTDININPDGASGAIVAILPAVEANMGYNTIGGSDLCRVTSIWLQQLQGIERQSLATADYQLREGDVNNQWNTDFAGTMMDLNQIMILARAENNLYALGVAQILMANSLGVCTDVWNEIPYTNAFLGANNLNPVFNTQQEIYQTIQLLLDSAITNLGTDGPWTIDGDMIYGGDVPSWMRTAYAFKARYSLHLSKINGTTAYTEALAALPNAFTEFSQDCQFVFGNTEGFSNPLYQFMTQRGDISMHQNFIDMLQTRFDPRITVYATTDAAGGYSGNSWGGSSYDVSFPGSAVADMGSAVPFITYAECLFIKAEAELMTGGALAQVRIDLINAVTASMDKLGVLNPDYITAYTAVVDTMGTGTLLYEVMTQKYIALYYQAEAYNDWRRTGMPVLTPNPDGSGPNITPEIPRRFPYSTDEINYNSNCPDYGTIWDRVWWDPAPGK
jgi:hypothetical protein